MIFSKTETSRVNSNKEEVPIEAFTKYKGYRKLL